jgi:hypothetical protein
MCRLISAACAVAASLGICNLAAAATMDQLRKIDFNHNGALDAGGEFRAYLDLEKLTGELDSKKQAKVGYLQSDIALRGNIPFDQLAEEEEQQATGCESGQGLYLRRDKLDVSIYNQSIDESAAEGATISYTNNSEDDTDTAEIQALAAWVFARNPCVQRPVGLGVTRPFVSAYAFALSVLADGNLTNDRKTEKSALKPGLDAQIEIASGPLDLQALTVSPYYQTDFRGEAQAYGVEASWEPYKLDWRLGGSYRQFSPLFDFFYQLKAEMVGLRVNDAGLTDLKPDTDYWWWGGTAALRAFLLPDMLNDRLTWITTYKYYFDDRSDKDIDLFTTALAYNLTESGNTSVSVEYEKGTVRDTLEKVDQYMVTLNAKY